MFGLAAQRNSPHHFNRFPLPPAPDGSPVNHPANIAVAYEQLALLRGVPLASLAPQIEKNFRRLFI